MKQQKSVSMGQVVLIAIVVSLITSLVVLVLGASVTGNAVIGTKVDNGVFNTVDANLHRSVAPQGVSELASWGLKFNWTVPNGTQGAGKYESIVGSSSLNIIGPGQKNTLFAPYMSTFVATNDGISGVYQLSSGIPFASLEANPQQVSVRRSDPSGVSSYSVSVTSDSVIFSNRPSGSNVPIQWKCAPDSLGNFKCTKI